MIPPRKTHFSWQSENGDGATQTWWYGCWPAALVTPGATARITCTLAPPSGRVFRSSCRMWSKQEITKSQNWGRHWCSVANWCLTLCDPTDRSTPGSPVLHYLQECIQIHVFESVMLSNHLILCRSLLLLPSIFPSIRVFSNESALHIRWPAYWSFSLIHHQSFQWIFRIDFL